jgi:hypothetical protein
VPASGDQATEETDQQVSAYMGLESAPVEIPASFVREVIAAGEADS